MCAHIILRHGLQGTIGIHPLVTQLQNHFRSAFPVCYEFATVLRK